MDTIFTHPTHCMRVLIHLHLVMCHPVLHWDLELVIYNLLGWPFELMATCPLHLLFWKTAFLVAFTLARQVVELQVLWHESPYMTIHAEGVSLFSRHLLAEYGIRFPSASHYPSSYLLSLSIELCQGLQSLDVQRALLLYLNQTAAYHKDDHLFLACSGCKKGHAVSSQRLSKWNGELMMLSFLVAKWPLPGSIWAHCTRAMGTSVAFLQGMPLHDICHAATWASLHIFMHHYTLNVQLQLRSWLGRDVLQECSWEPATLSPGKSGLACYSPKGVMHRGHKEYKQVAYL